MVLCKGCWSFSMYVSSYEEYRPFMKLWGVSSPSYDKHWCPQLCQNTSGPPLVPRTLRQIRPPDNHQRYFLSFYSWSREQTIVNGWPRSLVDSIQISIWNRVKEAFCAWSPGNQIEVVRRVWKTRQCGSEVSKIVSLEQCKRCRNERVLQYSAASRPLRCVWMMARNFRSSFLD